MSVSFSDIMTVAKNIPVAINNLAKTYLAVQGAQSANSISAATLVQLGTGRVATVSVTTAGSAAGAIYDANSASSTTGQIYVIPNTVGIVVVNLPVGLGLVVAPGTGQVVAVSYS